MKEAKCALFFTQPPSRIDERTRQPESRRGRRIARSSTVKDPPKLSHLNNDGQAQMVDVSQKDITGRLAIASGSVIANEEAMRLVASGQNKKGNVEETARLAGILAAKQTSSLIPLCHALSLDHVDVELTRTKTGFDIRASVRSSGKTGVEMEALTAVSVTALTIYDMLKAVDKSIVIGEVRLLEKRGGKSGDYLWHDPQPETPEPPGEED